MDGGVHGERKVSVSGVRALLVGARGQVAMALRAEIEKRWQQQPVLASPNPERGEILLDLNRPETIAPALIAFRQETEAAATVFLVGAWTNVEACEADPERCYRMNTESVARIAAECAKLDLRLVFFSSEYVYGAAEYEGGPKGPFREEDPVAPPCVYGVSKARAELALKEYANNLNFVIVRTTIVYSWLREDKNFAMQLLRFLRAQVSPERVPGSVFRIPTDQITTPTFAPDLARACLDLEERGLQGIWHVVGSDCISRAEFTLRLVDCFGFSREEVMPYLHFLPTAELQQRARRPLSAGLDASKAKRNGVFIGDLQGALARFCTAKP